MYHWFTAWYVGSEMEHTQEYPLLPTDVLEPLLFMWNAVYPREILHKDVTSLQRDLTRNSDYSHILLYREDLIVGWYFDFLRDGDRWFGIIVHPEHHESGYGSKLIRQAQSKRKRLNGWVIDKGSFLKEDGTPYRSPLPFYQNHGFIVLDEEWKLGTMVLTKIQWTAKE